MKLELTKKEIALIQEMIDDAKDRARDRLNECYDDEDFAIHCQYFADAHDFEAKIAKLVHDDQKT
mgnify:CR=1 FL=1